MNIAICLLIPLLGTVLGAATVYVVRGQISPLLQKAMLGFASGVMIAAGVWSLLIPSIEMSSQAALPWLPAAVGFLAGVGFLLLLDTLTPHLHINSKTPEGPASHLGKSTMLVLAVTLHNIPEGMAVGVVAAGAVTGNVDISLAAALALSIGIAIQNFPEGAIISMPLRATGMSRNRSFVYGAMSGVVEPVAAVLTLLLLEQMLVVLPYLLAFAAGAMIYVVVEELIPSAQQGKHSNIATIGVAVGFVVMMILDVALS